MTGPLQASGLNPASANDFDGFGGTAFPSGTVTFPSGSANNVQTITIMLSEDTTVEGDEGFTVTLTPGSQAHTPDSMAVPDDSIDIVDGSQSATIVNDDMAMLTILDEQVNEAAGTVTLTVAVDNAVQGGFTVGYSTTDGTATTADNDYDDTTGTVTFDGTAGETETFTVAINNDSTVEPDETFNVALGPVTGTTPTSVASDIDASDGAVVTILNDDIDITLGAAVPLSQNEGNPGDATVYTFTVTRSGLTSGITTVGWEVSAPTGSAVTADDFDFDGDGIPDAAFPSGIVTFADGVLTQDIVIGLAEDTNVEPNEDFVVTLLNDANLTHTPTNPLVDTPVDPVNGVQLGDDGTGVFQQTATIVDDDMAVVSIGSASEFETSGTPIITVPVSVDVAVQDGFEVQFEIEDITATLGDDYQVLTSSPLEFNGTAGQTINIEIQFLGDDDVEIDEQFRIILTEAIPNDSDIDPANIKLDGAALESSATLLIEGSTFNDSGVSTATGIVPGFDGNTFPGNDDGSVSANLGFNANFFGQTFSSVFVNNNGNITFGSQLGTFTPFDLTSTNSLIIAPFFADVDTNAGNPVTFGTGYL